MKPVKNHKIVALGDSITFGYPFTPEDSWVGILRRERGWDIVNKGVNGDTLDGMLERFERDVQSFSPDMLIVTGGTNDAFNEYSLESMENNLREIIKKAKALGIKPVTGIPIPADDPAVEKKLEKFRGFLKEFCFREGIPYIDFYRALAGDSGRIKPEFDFDGVHPSREGYRAMAKAASKVIEEVSSCFKKLYCK